MSSPSSPSPPSSSLSSYSIYRTPIVTTTIFSPSATSPIQPTNDNNRPAIPVGSIVGGCLAGIVLAVAAVVGWHLWGRSIKRREEAKRKEAISRHATNMNTRLNAFASLPSSYTPSFQTHSQDRKVKFAVHTPNTQPNKVSQIPALYHASLPTRPSPLSQSGVTIEQSTVR